jgi:hypothetical protein
VTQEAVRQKAWDWDLHERWLGRSIWPKWLGALHGELQQDPRLEAALTEGPAQFLVQVSLEVPLSRVLRALLAEPATTVLEGD